MKGFAGISQCFIKLANLVIEQGQIVEGNDVARISLLPLFVGFDGLICVACVLTVIMGRNVEPLTSASTVLEFVCFQ